MIGYISHEGMVFEMMNKQMGTPMEYHLNDFEKAIPAYYNVKKGSDLSKTIAKMVEEFYYKKSKNPDNVAENYYKVSTF